MMKRLVWVTTLALLAGIVVQSNSEDELPWLPSLLLADKSSAVIISPAENTVFYKGLAVDLAGVAHGKKGDLLSGSAMKWVSDRDGVIGTGNELSVSTLSTGMHSITLSVMEDGRTVTTVSKSLEIALLKEINYYPRDNAWDLFWTDWDSAKVQMAKDLEIISSWGANTVRIFLMPDIFGFPEPSQIHLDHFEEMLTLVDAYSLKAHVNLFDCFWTVGDIQGSKNWLDKIVVPHLNDPRIALWELRNEIEMEIPAVRDWYAEMMPYLHNVSGSKPTSVSTNRINYLDDLKDLAGDSPPQIYGFHWYPEGDLMWTHFLEDDLSRLLNTLPGETILLGEFGYSTSVYSEESQAKLYRDVFYYANENGIDHLGSWCYTDFPEYTTQCGENMPEESQWYYGLLRSDGSEKPALEELRAYFEGTSPASPSVDDIVNSSFEQLNRVTAEMDNWRDWDQNWSEIDYSAQDCSVARTGNCSIEIHSSAGITVGVVSLPSLPVSDSITATLRGFARTENLTGWAGLAISWYEWTASGENYLSSSFSNQITEANQDEWTELTIGPLSPPANADLALVFALVNAADSNARVWFDDITIFP